MLMVFVHCLWVWKGRVDVSEGGLRFRGLIGVHGLPMGRKGRTDM